MGATETMMAQTDEQLRPADGIACPRCGCCHQAVLYVRRQPSRVIRVRECRNCLRRIRTVETLMNGTPRKRGE